MKEMMEINEQTKYGANRKTQEIIGLKLKK